MDVEEVLKLAKKGKFDQIESAWTELLGEQPGDLRTLFRVPDVLVERGRGELAESLVWYLVDLLAERGDTARALDAARSGGRLLPRSELLRGLLADLFTRVYAERADVEDLVKLTVRSPRLPLDEAMASLENLMAVRPGTYMLDPQRGAVGRVEGLDADRGGLVVTFEEGEKVYGAGLVGRLQLTDEEDFRALAVFERERLAKLAADDPEDLVRILLTTIDRRMELRRLRLYLEPVVGSWTKWWSGARRALKRSSEIGMTEGRSPSLFLRRKPLTMAQRLVQRFDRAAGPLRKLAAALHVLRESQAQGEVGPEARQHVVDAVSAMVGEGRSPLAVAAAAVAEALGDGWDDVAVGEPPAAGMADLLAAPENLAGAGLDADVLLCTLDFVRRHVPSGWAQFAASLMPLVDREACRGIAQRLAAEAPAELAEACREILVRPERHPGSLAWLWREGVAQVDASVVAVQVLSHLGAIVRAADLADDERKGWIAELRSSLFVRDGAPLRAALEGARPEQIAALKDHAERNPALTDRMQEDLLAMLQDLHPELFARARPVWEEGVVYTTRAGIERRQAELEDIVHVRLPEVIREIGQAASFGDLSDNAEYRSAVAERARLAERAGRIQEELSGARLITHELASSDHVTIGSRVMARNLADGQVETFAFLGPWDAAPEQRIYAYNAPLGQAFMGKAVGDMVSFQVGAEERRWEIISFGPALSPAL